MSAPNKIRGRHLERAAFIYVRQSSPAQVRDNRESQGRQYALVEQAAQLGWPASKIDVIDADQGISGRTADRRSGFREVVSRVCLGEVGAIFSHRRFPRRAYGGAWAGELRWGRLTHSRVVGMLSNPAYAGAYVFGRYRSRQVVAPDGSVRDTTYEQPRSEWSVVIQDHHPGFISWEQYLANQQHLAAN